MKRDFSALLPLSAVLSLLLSLVIAIGGTPAALAGPQSAAPAGAMVYLIEPTDGQTVTSPFTAKFGLSGMGIAPAGVERENTGHHHLLIDMAELPDLTEPLAASENLKHFGGGQTEAEISLPTGEHTLQLVLGNYSHIPHDQPVISEKVAITVR